MAENKLLDGRNNMKRGDSYTISEIYVTAGDFNIAKLPKHSVVIESYLNVLEGDSADTATMDILVNGITVNDEVDVKTIGVNTGTMARKYFPTGGTIEVKTGAKAGNGDGKQQLVLRYVELEKVTGEYTEV